MRTVVIAAFVNDDMQKGFPAEQSMLAVRTEVFGLKRSLRTVIDLKERRADFAAQLRAGFPVVVIQVLVWGIAVRALFGLRDGLAVTQLDRF